MAYAVYHQFGTTRMPARPFLALDAQARADIAEILLG
jgi:phage gpG-like protein